MIAVLDNIRSVHNVGSMFRTADGVGIEKMYCCGVTPTPLDRFGRPRKDFAKVSLGAEKFVEWDYAASTARLLSALKKQGYTVIALEQSEHSVSRIPKSSMLTSKFCLVVGNEVNGLSPAILKRADSIIEIPMRGKKESLNVSVAFGIAAYSLLG